MRLSSFFMPGNFYGIDLVGMKWSWSQPHLYAEQHYDLSRNHPQEHFYRVNCGIGN